MHRHSQQSLPADSTKSPTPSREVDLSKATQEPSYSQVVSAGQGLIILIYGSIMLSILLTGSKQPPQTLREIARKKTSAEKASQDLISSEVRINLEETLQLSMDFQEGICRAMLPLLEAVFAQMTMAVIFVNSVMTIRVRIHTSRVILRMFGLRSSRRPLTPDKFQI